MASEVKANKLSPSSGTDLTLGDASDTVIVPTGVTLNIVDDLGVAYGGTGLSSFTAGDVLYATGTTTLAKLAKGTAEQILSMNSGATAPEWATAAATAGGTGQTGFTAGDILYANSTTTLTKLGKGTGLQGLQTNSGATAPEWANSPQSLMTAEGDILYASGANTLAKLAKGSDDEVLTLASGVPSWAAAAGGGKIGQVVSTNLTTVVSANPGGTFADIAGMTVDITPAATTSKVYINFAAAMSINGSNEASGIRLMRDTTPLAVGTSVSSRAAATTWGLNDAQVTRCSHQSNMSYVDSPSSTSAISYHLEWIAPDVQELYLNRSRGDADSANSPRLSSTITVMEVLA